MSGAANPRGLPKDSNLVLGRRGLAFWLPTDTTMATFTNEPALSQGHDSEVKDYTQSQIFSSEIDFYDGVR